MMQSSERYLIAVAAMLRVKLRPLPPLFITLPIKHSFSSSVCEVETAVLQLGSPGACARSGQTGRAARPLI